MGKTALAVWLIIITLVAAGCGLTGLDYEDYMLLNKTENQYLADIASDLELAYAPKPGMTSDYVKSVLRKHMTEDVVSKLVGWEGKVADNDIDSRVTYVGLAYGKHQRDGITRVLVSMDIKHGESYWVLDMELKVGKEGKVYEISVY